MESPADCTNFNTLESQNQDHRVLGTPEAAPCLSSLKERMEWETMGLSLGGASGGLVDAGVPPS